MSNETRVLLAAGVGAVAPNLMKIAMVCTAGPVKIPGVAFILTYILGLAVMVGLGVFIASAFKETNARKAIFIGLGLPAFLQVSIANVSQVYGDKPAAITDAVAADSGPSASLPFSFVGIAHADEIPPRPITSATAAPRKISIKADGDKKPEVVTFYSKDRKVVQKLEPQQMEGAGATEVAVPANAESFSVSYQGVNSAPMAIEPGTEANVNVEIKEKAWSGLQKAVGYNAAPAYKINVEKTAR